MKVETMPQVISASRRTDIPNHYANWFLQRLEEGYVLVRNVRDFHQVRRVDLTPQQVACIVFWTKNPTPMMENLDRLSSYRYLFQFTINPYGTDLEPRIPPMGEMTDCFRRLADKIGNDRIVWRYDPVLINKSYPLGYHIESFAYIARKLDGYVKRCTFSFLDRYRHHEDQLQQLEVEQLSEYTINTLARSFSLHATAHGMQLFTCAEPYDFSRFGISHGACIDADEIERISGLSLVQRRAKNQRPHCLCAPSIDIGMYNTCLNLCTYCYANHSEKKVHANYAQARTSSPLQIGTLGKNDTISDVTVSPAEPQLSLF
ncbi:MAG: DUF1848 domain-containing protein [Sphaerochaetaceae bacterium]|nr:DUF1848 domain-containing protein [Sphaerochaetaceae bacterium]